MNPKYLRALICACLASVSFAVNAAGIRAPESPLPAPILLHDGGGRPLADVLLGDEEQGDIPLPQEVAANPDPVEADRSRFPVTTPEMTIGPIGPDEATEIPAYLLTQPLFIVGYDRVSANWMREYVDILEENAAIGYVVNVDTPEQLDELRAATDYRLTLVAVPGKEIARTANLRHYPAYIDRQGIVR